MVVDGETGWLVPPANPPALKQILARALTEPRSCQVAGAAARERCEQVFSLECHVEAALVVYQDVLAQFNGKSLSAPAAQNPHETIQLS